MRAFAWLAALAAWATFGFALPANADTPTREAKIESYVAAQAAATPFLKERALPFLVRVALARKLEDAGRDGSLGPEWNPRAHEWQALEDRSEEISARAVETLTPTMTVEEGRQMLADVSDEELDALLAFQRSPLAHRMISAADYGISAVLMLSAIEGQVPPELNARRVELIAELEDHREEVRLSAEDQAELRKLLEQPAFARVAQANRARLERILSAEGGPLRRLNTVLQREVDATIAAFRSSHSTEAPR
jgi:hypothetical protein